MKFKIGDKVKVIRRSKPGEVHWAYAMNKSIGKTRRVLKVLGNGNLLLDDGYFYPKEGVQKLNVKNQQLLFNFMSATDST